MDKNQATGLILFAAVILTYSVFFASTPELPPVEETATTTTATPAVTPAEQALALPDSLLDAQRLGKFGTLASLTLGEEKEQILENEVVKITLSNKGGRIKEVLLKNYTSWKQEPLYLLDSTQTNLAFSLDTRTGPVDLSEFYFSPTLSTEEVEGVKQQVLTFTAGTEAGQLIQKYTLVEGSYALKKSLRLRATKASSLPRQ